MVPKLPSLEASRQLVFFSVNQRVVPGLADIVKLTRCMYPSNVTTSALGSSYCGPSLGAHCGISACHPLHPALILCPAARLLRSPSQSGSCLIGGQRLGDAFCAIHRPRYVKARAIARFHRTPNSDMVDRASERARWRQAPGCCMWPTRKGKSTF